MSSNNSPFASLTFKVAAEIWYENRKPHWKRSTADSYKQYIGRLNKYFADLRLEVISIQHMREYQKMNSALRENGRPLLVASSINHDLNALAQVLSEAGLWEAINPLHKQMPLRTWTPPPVLSEDEEDRFFEVAATNPSFSMAYWISSLTNNTSASASELRKVQLKHIDLDSEPPLLYVLSDSVRNEYGARVIPLNERGMIQVKRILNRADSLGCRQPEHYLCPFRLPNGRYDPTRPASPWFIYKQWGKLVDAALRAGAISRRIRPLDLRYNVVAKMLKVGAPEHTVMSIAGHVRPQMFEHYAYERISAKARALNMLDPKMRKK